MKPEEYWENILSQNILYAQSNLIRTLEERRFNIELEESSTDKIISSNPMLYKKPRPIKLKNIFKSLFPEKKKKQQTPEEQAKIFFAIIENEKGIWQNNNLK